MKRDVSIECDCASYRDNIGKVNGPIINEGLRYGTQGYTGETFRFCPWCGKPLVEKSVHHTEVAN